MMERIRAQQTMRTVYFEALHPMRSRSSTHQVEALFAPIGHVLDVLRPRWMTVEDDSEELQAVLVDQTRGSQLQRQVSCRRSSVFVVDTLNPQSSNSFFSRSKQDCRCRRLTCQLSRWRSFVNPNPIGLMYTLHRLGKFSPNPLEQRTITLAKIKPRQQNALVLTHEIQGGKQEKSCPENQRNVLTEPNSTDGEVSTGNSLSVKILNKPRDNITGKSATVIQCVHCTEH